MARSEHSAHSDDFDKDAPSVSCKPVSRALDMWRPRVWLANGWKDFRQAWSLSFTFGVLSSLFFFVFAAVFFASEYYASLADVPLDASLLTSLFAPLFVPVVVTLMGGPLIAFAFYDISNQLSLGRRPKLKHCMLLMRHVSNQELMYAFMLLIIVLFWLRAAMFMTVFLPQIGELSWKDTLPFFLIGSTIGFFFLCLVFAVSAFSLPMMMDKRVDFITAVAASVSAVYKNVLPMAVWAAIIVFLMVLGLVTLGLGFAIVIPWVGHATWHAYKDTFEDGA